MEGKGAEKRKDEADQVPEVTLGFQTFISPKLQRGVDQKSLNIQMIFSEVFYSSTAVAMTSDFASDTGKNWWSCTQPVLAEWLMDNSQQSWPCPFSVTRGIACGPIN